MPDRAPGWNEKLSLLHAMPECANRGKLGEPALPRYHASRLTAFIHSSIHSSIHSLIYSSIIHPFIQSSIHSFIHPSIHPSIH